jgi:uncharacterized protein (TIRG00374 family)
VSRLWLAVRLLILAGVIGIALTFVDPRAIWKTLTALPGPPLILALALAACDRMLMAIKWWQIIHAAGGRAPLRPLISAYFQATFAGYVVPSAIGAELVRAYLGAQAGIGSGVLLVSMAAERAIGAIGCALLAAIALTYLGLRLTSPVMLLLAVSAIVTIAGVVWLLTPWLMDRLARTFEKRRQLIASLRELRTRNTRTLAINLGLAMIEQLLQLTVVAVIARALGVQVTSLATLATFLMILTVRRVAAYLESWGLAEGITIGLYTLAGVTPERAAALALASFAVLVTASSPGGVLLLRSGVIRAARSRVPEAAAPVVSP